MKIATGGRAQALVMNYEQEIVAHFGPEYSLADRLRFPMSLQALTAEGREQLQEAAKKLPKHTRDLVARFEAAIDPAVLDDLRYDYRVRLVPVIGSKSDADLAINFVKLDELGENERRTMVEAGRLGTVIEKVKHVEVADKDKLLPGRVARLVEEQVPFEFSASHEHAMMWRRLGVRPATGAPDPRATNAKYCIYSEAFRTYVYTPAWVKKIIREIGTVEKYRAFFGKDPRLKTVTPFPKQLGAPEASDAQQRSKSA
ncbi:DUF3644 domain-containing protein [Streptomyces afghaniensis]|uniref:DUF3644 domain-containing protein n=1 Tax=Streptomyces afghaniensis TaxID=66865 RepID=UPI0033B1A29A